MKIALCLSGQPRFVKEFYPIIYSNLLEPNNPDIFIHTWFDPTMLTKPFRYGKGWVNDRIEEDAVDFVIKHYQPISYKIDPPIDFYKEMDLSYTFKSGYAGGFESSEGQRSIITSSYSMWYSIMASNNLKETHRLANNIQYDYVIRCRFDQFIGNKIVATDHDPQFMHHQEFGYTNLMINWFNLSNNTNMNIYSSMFNLLDYYFNKTNIWCNEFFLKQLCTDFNIPTRAANWNLNLKFKPI